ncbi:MAG: hypothetical protein Q9227_009372 [Pyrenula ochraceoflavens]
MTSPRAGFVQEVNSEPSNLCCWTVHLYEGFFDQTPLSAGDLSEWPLQWMRTSKLLDKLRNGLESNDFSNIDANELPASVPQLLRRCRKKRDDLLLEAFEFSILARNIDLLMSLSLRIESRDADVSDLRPFHIAAAYLDGAHQCCNMMSALIYGPIKASPKHLYVDLHGYTILDQLILSILKSRSRCKLGDIDPGRKREKRFMGEEVSICGRWDADSECVRDLFARGKASVPSNWKHNRLDMFSLLQDLQAGSRIHVALIEDGMINEYCSCGTFKFAKHKNFVGVAEACAFYFSNLEDWERTEYIPLPPKDWYETPYDNDHDFDDIASEDE